MNGTAERGREVAGHIVCSELGDERQERRGGGDVGGEVGELWHKFVDGSGQAGRVRGCIYSPPPRLT